MVADALSRQFQRGQFDSASVVLNRVELFDSDASSVFERVHYDHSNFGLFCLDNHCGLFLISFPYPTWLEELKSSYSTDADVQAILQTLHIILMLLVSSVCRLDSCYTKVGFTWALIVV